MKNVCKKAAIGNMWCQVYPFFFSSKFARLRRVFFQTLHVVHWSLKNPDFLMTVIYAEMLLRCRVWLQMGLCAVVMLKYWCGNLLASFGEPSTKTVGMFSICFPDLLFCLDEVQLCVGWRWSFAFLLGFTRNYVLTSYWWHLSRNAYGLFFSVWYLSLLYLLHSVSPSYFLAYFKINFYPVTFCGKQN